MILSKLDEDFYDGRISCSDVIEKIDSWRNPVVEVDAYESLLECARKLGDLSSSYCLESMLRIARLRAE